MAPIHAVSETRLIECETARIVSRLDAIDVRWALRFLLLMLFSLSFFNIHELTLLDRKF